MTTHHARCVGLLAAAGLAISAHAQVSSWLYPSNGSWNNLGNWTDGVPDTATDEAIIDATGGLYTVTLDINPGIASLVINSTDATLLANGRTVTAGTGIDLMAGTTTFTNGGFAGAGTFFNRSIFNLTGNVAITTSTFTNQGIANVIATGGFNSVLNRTGAMTNSGTINLTSTAATVSSLQVSTTFTNSPGGVVNSNAGSGGGRLFSVVSFQNAGTVNINTPTTANAANSLLNNAGAFNTAAGATFTMGGTGLLTFRQSAGTLANAGGVELNAERFEFAGGTITGNDVQITNGQLDITGAGAGGFDLIGANVVTGTIASGQHVDVVGTGAFNSVLNASSGMTNAGAINLTSVAATNATLQGTTIDSSGTIASLPASGGGRFVTVDMLSSSGTFEVNADTTFNGANSQFRNTGSFNTAPGRTAAVVGGGLITFNHSEGVINNLGAIALNGERFEFTINGSIFGNDIEITNGQLHMSSSGPGGFDIIGTNAYTGGVGPNQHVDVIGTGAFNSILNVAPAFTNEGVVNLTSTAATNSSINDFGGFNNIGALNSQPGAGGARTITAFSLQNTGAINVNANTTFDSPNSVTNTTGAFNTAPAATATFVGGGVMTFTHAGGTLDNLGAVFLNGERFEYTGGVMSGNDVQILNGQLHISGAGPGGFDVIGTNALTGTIAAGQHVDALATGAFNTTMSAALGMSNNGVLNLTSSAATNVSFNSPAGVTNAGTINSESAAGGSRSIGVSLLNNPGAIHVNTSTLFDGSGGRLNNSGAFTTLAGTTATFSGGGLLTFTSGGAIDNQGAIFLNGERFEFIGGSITGNDVQVLNGQLYMGPGLGAAGIDMIGAGTMTGATHPGQHVDLLATGSFNTTTSVVDAFANGGRISLTSSAATNTQLVSVPQFTNTGLVEVLPGAGGNRTLTISNFVNQGSFDVHANALMDASSGAIQNQGTITVDPGVTLTVTGGGVMLVNQNAGTITNNGAMLLNGERFNFNGGTTTGNNIRIRNGELNITATTAGAFELVGATTLSGNIASGQRIDALSTGADNTNVTSPSLLNAGQINLTSSAATNSQLSSDTGVTNAATGVVRFLPGAGGTRTISADVFNGGLIDVDYTGAINHTNLAVTNQGVIAIAAGATLSLQGGGFVSFINQPAGRVIGAGILDLTQVDAFNNPGTFAPGEDGDDIATLSVVGNYRQQGPGGVEIELAGLLPTQFDRLLVTGTVNLLSGLLLVELVDGFIPAPGDSFVILDGASLTGTFTNAVTSVGVIGGGHFDVLYNTGAGTVTLTNFVIPAPGTTGLLAMVGILAARRRR